MDDSWGDQPTTPVRSSVIKTYLSPLASQKDLAFPTASCDALDQLPFKAPYWAETTNPFDVGCLITSDVPHAISSSGSDMQAIRALFNSASF